MKKYKFKELALIMLKHLGAGAAAVVIFYILSKFLGSLCPTYRIFKICCPFCGMTRAHLSALKFDFKTAMYYNPAFFLGIPALFFVIHTSLFEPKYGKWRKAAAGILFGVIVAVYIVRVCIHGFDFFN